MNMLQSICSALVIMVLILSCTDGDPAQTSTDIIQEGATQEEDLARLQEAFDEIAALASSVSCEDEDDWAITAVGSKACGGPQGFLAYPSSIDVAVFLALVRTYTEAEAEYNQKWSVVSDCAVVTPPSRVVCTDGLPVLE